MAIRAAARSVILKRTQKENEDEWTAGGPAAVNGISSEILYLLDSAQGLFTPEGNIGDRVIAKRLAYRWLNRRSQSKSKNWKQFYAYIDRFPLASPRKLTDLIAMARER